MSQFSDQKLAQRLLEARDRGYSYRFFLRQSAWKYLFMIVYFGSCLAFLAYVQYWSFFSLIAGLVGGSLLRDYSWVRAITRTYPFNMKVTDWNEVKRLASEEPME